MVVLSAKQITSLYSLREAGAVWLVRMHPSPDDLSIKVRTDQRAWSIAGDGTITSIPTEGEAPA